MARGYALASILIIDDDGFYRGVLRRILEEGGHRVIESSDGQEAVQSYGVHRPDLVITDIFMPGMDGSEVIRALKDIDADAKIIAVSGGGTFYDIDVLDMAKKLGASAVLRKLDPRERVLGEVERVLEAAHS
jgi:CheY-like chemotaxis protein